MSKPIGPGKAPCVTCPYRRDVPSGLWSPEEYAKLPAYDGDTGEQIMKGATGVFLCHSQPGKLCSGWVGCHDMRHNAAVRFDQVAETTFTYQSPVPLFTSGAEVAAHGMKDIAAPGREAGRAIKRLTVKMAKR